MTKLQKTVELANLALDVAKESLWINNLVPNQLLPIFSSKRDKQIERLFVSDLLDLVFSF